MFFQRFSRSNKARTRETDEPKSFFFLFPYEQTTITMLFEQGCISQQSNRKKVERQTVCTGFWFSSFSIQSVNIWRRPNEMESQRVSRPPFPVQWSRVASHSASRQTLSNSADKWVSFGQRGGTSSCPEESAGYKTHSATIGERENLFSSSSFFYPASSFISLLFFFSSFVFDSKPWRFSKPSLGVEVCVVYEDKRSRGLVPANDHILSIKTKSLCRFSPSASACSAPLVSHVASLR